MILNPWKEIKRLHEQVRIANRNESMAFGELSVVLKREDKMHAALCEIAAMETPRCSNVVRKAARVAREAIHD
jgi:hypothetical protein